MKVIRLFGKLMTNKDAVHDHLMQQFSFPAHYGRNLDALHDLLGEINTSTIIAFYNFNAVKIHLGEEYAHSLLKVLRDCAKNNPVLDLVVYRDFRDFY